MRIFLRIEQGQDGKCGMGWQLHGFKIVLLLFNVGTQSNPYKAKLTSKILALSKEKTLFYQVNRQSVRT
jgi:hypothetical protein